MLRPGHLLSARLKLNFSLPKNVAIDLGSSYTRVKVDNTIVFHDRTCIVFHRESQDIIAIGQTAETFQGKVPSGMRLVRPIRMGKVADVNATHLFLQAVLHKVNSPAVMLPIPFISQQVVVANSASTSSVQKELLRHFARNLHATCSFKPKSEALFTTLLTPQMRHGTWCCIDIGGMTTEIAIWANGQVLTQQTLEIGGDFFTKQILSVTKKKYQAEIGWLTAEQIKKNLLCLATATEKEVELVEERSTTVSKSRRVKSNDESKFTPIGKFTVRARSSSTDLPTTIALSASTYVKPLEEVAQELVWLIKESTQDLSPELLSTALENGILLTGGGSLLPGLATYLEQQLQTSILLSQHPREDVVRGL